MSSSNSPTPFTAQRYELDGSHVYHLPPAVFSVLERPIPTYLVGTRGTGKTTLLRALSWDERLNNPWLKEHLGAKPFEASYIGLYFKLPNLQLALLDRWLRDEEDSDYGPILAFYLDLSWLEALLPAIEHLTAANVITITPAAEEDFHNKFDSLFDNCTIQIPRRGESGRTLRQTLSQMHLLRNALERAARRKEGIVDVLESLPIGQVGFFGRAVGKLLISAIDSSAEAESPTWSLRVCMDEGEALSLRQQRVINSMARVAEWPVFYIVAYVSRPLDVTNTFLPNQTLQIADRQIYLLDDISDKEFKHLAEGVVNSRLQVSRIDERFDAKRTLGELDIDGLLLRILKVSVGTLAEELMERAEALDSTSDIPSIYEAYLRMRRPEMEDGGTGRARRRFSSSSVRKQMVAAYLSICREIGSEPLYASSDMALQVSDKCMRDFLRTMEHVYSASNRSVSEFLSERVSIDAQNRGIKAAAELKMTLFRERVVSAAAEATQFVDILGKATAMIQSTGRNAEQLRTPERGVYTYQRMSAGAAPTSSELLIRDAADGGFLKILPDDSAQAIRFRVHASLAPHYGFSYRGAYYDACTLTDLDIEAMRNVGPGARPSVVLERLVERVTRRRSRSTDERQLSLFDGPGGPE